MNKLTNLLIKSASIDYLHDQDKIESKIPVVSVSDRGKQIANSPPETRQATVKRVYIGNQANSPYGTCSRICTVDYKIKGDRGKILGKTIEVGNVP